MLLSIIVPAYNAEKTIERCVVSLTGQSFSDIEIIIVNDGSTDGTAAIINTLQKTDGRIKCIHGKNRGVSYARNCGMAAACGEYIMFCDADDTYKRDMCEKLISARSESGADFTMCGYTEIYKSKTVQSPCPFSENDDIFSDIVLPLAFSGVNGFMGCITNGLFSSKIIKSEKLRFNENVRIAEDLLFLCSYLLCCKSFAGISDCLYNYYLNDASVTKNYSGALEANCRELEKSLFFLLSAHGITPPENAANKLALSFAISLIINEARRGNKKPFVKKLLAAVAAPQIYKERIKAVQGSSRTLKLKKMIALNPLFSAAFFFIRRIQTLLGVAF